MVVVGVVGVVDVVGLSELVMVLSSVDSIIFSSIVDSGEQNCLKDSHASSIFSVVRLSPIIESSSSVVNWRFSMSLNLSQRIVVGIV